MTEESRPSSVFHFSREIRLGDLITVLGVGVATIAAWQKVDMRVDLVEKAVAGQVVTNKEMRQDIQHDNDSIVVELKEQGAAIRRVEDKINRARL